MHTKAKDNLVKAVAGQHRLTEELLKRVDHVSNYISSNRPEFWDMFFLSSSFKRSLAFATPALETNLPWVSSFSSAIVDEAVYARGLLRHTLRLAIDLGLIASVEDCENFKRHLFAGRNAEKVVVAYFDYLGTTGVNIEIWDSFSSIGQSLAVIAKKHNLCSFYWRSSDIFYVFGVVDTHEDNGNTCEKLIDMLLDIQNTKYFGESSWKWQIGVTLGNNEIIGDIFLPQKKGSDAAKLMDAGKLPQNRGGLILIDKAVYEKLGRSKELFHDVTTQKVEKGFKMKSPTGEIIVRESFFLCSCLTLGQRDRQTVRNPLRKLVTRFFKTMQAFFVSLGPSRVW